MRRGSGPEIADGEIDSIASRLRDQRQVTIFVRRRGAPVVDGRCVTAVFPGEATAVELGQEELAALLLLDTRGEVNVTSPFTPGVGRRQSQQGLVSPEIGAILGRLAGLTGPRTGGPQAGG